MGDARVNAGNAGLAAADAPGNHPGQLPTAVMLADHRTAAVALASVFTLFAAGADKARMQIEVGPEPRPFHLLFADVIADHRYVHLLQYVLILAIVAEGVLAPAGGPTPIVHHDLLLDLKTCVMSFYKDISRKKNFIIISCLISCLRRIFGLIMTTHHNLLICIIFLNFIDTCPINNILIVIK